MRLGLGISARNSIPLFARYEHFVQVEGADWNLEIVIASVALVMLTGSALAQAPQYHISEKWTIGSAGGPQ